MCAAVGICSSTQPHCNVSLPGQAHCILGCFTLGRTKTRLQAGAEAEQMFLCWGSGKEREGKMRIRNNADSVQGAH